MGPTSLHLIRTGLLQHRDLLPLRQPLEHPLIQNDLFDLGADLAVPQRDGKAERLRMLSTQVERLERDIDTLNERLSPLTSFVLPGGTPAAAYLHLAAPYVAGRSG